MVKNLRKDWVTFISSKTWEGLRRSRLKETFERNYMDLISRTADVYDWGSETREPSRKVSWSGLRIGRNGNAHWKMTLGGNEFAVNIPLE